MRITDLYDLKNSKETKKKIKEALIEDIESLAEAKFNGDSFKKFSIKIKLEPISKYY